MKGEYATAGLNSWMIGNRDLRPFDGADDGLPNGIKHLEHVSPRLFLEEYARGAVCVAIQFDVSTGRDICDGNSIARTKAGKDVTRHSEELCSVGVVEGQRGVAGGLHGDVHGAMLVSDVQRIEQVKELSLAVGKGLVSEKQFTHPIVRSFEALARSNKCVLGFRTGELQVAVLCASVVADDLPRHVVERGAQIMNSVAYYWGEPDGHSFVKSDLDEWLTGMRIVANTKFVGLECYKSLELPFKVRSMVVCALDL